MRRRGFLAVLGGAVIAGPLSAVAALPVGIPRTGLLMGADPSEEATKLDAFLGALQKNSATPRRGHRVSRIAAFLVLAVSAAAPALAQEVGWLPLVGVLRINSVANNRSLRMG